MELQKFQKIHNKIIERQLQTSMIKKYLKIDIHLQNKDRKLFMIWDYYNNIVMEYWKIINLLDNTQNQPSKFRTKNWVEINDDTIGRYNINGEIKLKT